MHEAKRKPDGERPGKYDEVAKPEHYTKRGIEVIEVIETYDLGFNLGNTIKYVLRADDKGARVQDLKKARQYLTREINALEGNGKGWEP